MLLRILDYLHASITYFLFATLMIGVGFVLGVGITMKTVEENLAHWGWQEIPTQCEPLNYTPINKEP